MNWIGCERKIYPEIDYLLNDHATMEETVKQHEEMLAQGKLLLLNELKLHPVLFCYYTSLPSYSVFTSLFNYLQTVASDMQYVSQAGKLHHAERFARKPGKQRVLSLENEFSLLWCAFVSVWHQKTVHSDLVFLRVPFQLFLIHGLFY